MVYAYTGLGNFILYTPTLKAIRRLLPEASFTLLHGHDTGCHEVISKGTIFNKYIVIRRKDARWEKIKWIYKIRKEQYDLIISEFHNNDLFTVFLTTFSGVEYRLGHISSPGWRNDYDWLYNIPVKMKENQHEIDRYLELAYALGISRQGIDQRPFVQIDPDDRRFAEKFLISNDIRNEDKIIGVQIGVSPTQRWKQWDLNKYRILCDMILELSNTKLILLGSSNELNMAKDLAGKMKYKPIIAVGKTTIKQTGALIEKSDLFIGNDSGLMHVAVAVDTPVVAIYGPTDYTRTAPRGEKHTIIRKDLDCSPCFRMDGNKKVKACSLGYQCLNSIGVDEVFEAVKAKILRT